MQMTLTIPQAHRTALEHVAAEYGMSLHQAKTALPTRPDQLAQRLKLLDGSMVPVKQTIEYLGSMIEWSRQFRGSIEASSSAS